mgnify:CR=1 FL=1
MLPVLPVNAPYHHGDLRAAALQVGMEKLADQEQPDLGLRALARDLGVSATALYRHFPNKDALLDALALEGLSRLGHSQAEAAEAAGGGEAGFAEVGITYVEWAVRHPALLRLIYSRVDLAPEERTAATLHAWSLVHGLAMLILDGQIDYDPAMIRKVVLMTDFRAP